MIQWIPQEISLYGFYLKYCTIFHDAYVKRQYEMNGFFLFARKQEKQLRNQLNDHNQFLPNSYFRKQVINPSDHNEMTNGSVTAS